MNGPTLSTDEAAKAAGASTSRAIYYWIRRGCFRHIDPAGSGFDLVWYPDDVERLRVVVALRKIGLGLDAVLDALRGLERLGWPDRPVGDLYGSVWITPGRVSAIPPSLERYETAVYLYVDERQ